MIHWSAAIPAGAIALREGTEAALVVGIVLACLAKAQRSALRPWVYGGILTGLAVSLLGGALALGLGRRASLDGLSRELWQGSISLLAVLMLSWMLVWMTGQAKQMRSAISASVDRALDGSSGWPLWGLVAIAVGREGIETVVFVMSQTDGEAGAFLGAVAGWVVAAGLVSLLLAGTLRIDLGQFFRVMGLLLLGVVGGLVISALQHLDQAAVMWGRPEICLWPSAGVCNLGPLVWQGPGWLLADRLPGLLLKTFLGYRDRLHALQLTIYLLFWVAIGGSYWRSLQPPSPTAEQKLQFDVYQKNLTK
jgi:high-affinity iron transporter